MTFRMRGAMPYYASSDDFYTLMRALFERLLAEGRLNRIDARLRIYISVSQPVANLLINTRTTPPQVTFGPANGSFDLEVSMTGDTVHAIWTNQLELREALAQGRIRIKGLPFRAIALKPIFDAAETLYPTVLAERGRSY